MRKRERAFAYMEKHCRLRFLFLLPLSNQFHCLCLVLLYFKTPQTSHFLTQSIYWTSFTHCITHILIKIYFFFISTSNFHFSNFFFLDELVSNLKYEYEDGRMAASKTLASVIENWPMEALNSQAQTFFLHCTLRVANEESAPCRVSIFECLKR